MCKCSGEDFTRRPKMSPKNFPNGMVPTGPPDLDLRPMFSCHMPKIDFFGWGSNHYPTTLKIV